MKKKILALAMVAVLALAMTACGSSSDAAETEAPETEAAEETVEETEAEEIEEAGEDLVFTYSEDRGDFAIEWQVTLKADGSYVLQETHGLSGEVTNHTGSEWTDNGDGTYTTGAWNESADMSEFFEADGSCTWIDNGDGTLTPAGAQESAEEEGPVGDDGGEVSELVGEYTYEEDRGDFTITWTVHLNGNGSFILEELHGLSQETTQYTGSEWTDNGDGTVTTGPWNESGDKSEFFEEDGSCTWTVNEDGTLTPVNAE